MQEGRRIQVRLLFQVTLPAEKQLFEYLLRLPICQIKGFCCKAVSIGRYYGTPHKGKHYTLGH